MNFVTNRINFSSFQEPTTSSITALWIWVHQRRFRHFVNNWTKKMSSLVFFSTSISTPLFPYCLLPFSVSILIFIRFPPNICKNENVLNFSAPHHSSMNKVCEVDGRLDLSVWPRRMMDGYDKSVKRWETVSSFCKNQRKRRSNRWYDSISLSDWLIDSMIEKVNYTLQISSWSLLTEHYSTCSNNRLDSSQDNFRTFISCEEHMSRETISFSCLVHCRR